VERELGTAGAEEGRPHSKKNWLKKREFLSILSSTTPLEGPTARERSAEETKGDSMAD